MLTKDLMRILNAIAPFSMAEEYDNPGLIVGNLDTEIRGILLALDLTEDVIKEAESKDANVIITHHPFIFNPIKKIDTSSRDGRIISSLISKNICSVAMHTNMDKARNGLNDYLCEVTGIKNVKILEDDTQCCCVCVYVPKGNAEDVKSAMFAAGAGSVGGYRGCAFETDGIGQFEPLEGAKPFIGEVGGIETVDETKIEVYCDVYRLGAVIYAMVEAHPYEQPVYYAFKSKAYGEYGFGRYGELDEETSLNNFCKKLINVLGKDVRFTGDPEKRIRTVGVCSGAGGDMYKTASALGLDAFITGDVKHNVSVEASRSNTALIDAGHYGTEAIFKNIMGRHLQNWFNELQYSVNIIYSEVEKSPWNYV